MQELRRPIPPPRVADRPGRWKLLLRRQRRLLRPAALASILAVAALVVIASTHVVGNVPPMNEQIGRFGAYLGMRVANVAIEGRQKTPEALLRSAIAAAPGEPILSYSIANARERIEHLTWVRQAIVERRLPNTIVVRLVERRPFAVWQYQGKFSLIDRAGEIVTDSDVAAFSKELPLVVGAGAPQAASNLLDLMAKQPTLMPHMVAAVRVGERRWNLQMNNGADVMLPDGAEEIALTKLADLQKQYSLLDRPLQAIDLRIPDRLVIRSHTDSASTDKPLPSPPAPSPPSKRPT